MTAPDDHDPLLDRLRAVAALVDPPPELVDEAARTALSTRRLDDELAELAGDSAAETVGAGATVRAEGEQIRLLSFETATVGVEVQVVEVDGSVSLRGLVSGATGAVTLETARASRSVAIGPDGWFTADGLAPGLVRLRLTAADGTPVTTSWVTL
jgi:hypothetical protein